MRKLSFEENLRHRLHDLPRFRYREEKSSTEGLMYLALGAVAGLAAGAILAQRFGGLGALTTRLRDRFGHEDEGEDDRHRGFSTHGAHDHEDDDYEDEEDDDEFEELSPMEELEERVLDAYHNDPILSERAIDIGAIDDGIIELTGWVHSTEESTHAVIIARGTPGVETVVNRLTIRDEEDEFDTRATRYAAGDDELAEAHWEGHQVGIGRPRQGASDDPDRHADPKPALENKWTSEPEAYKDAAEDMTGNAERRKSSKTKQTGDRTGGAPTTPTGVPKADHVADPIDAPQTKGTGDTNAVRGD